MKENFCSNCPALLTSADGQKIIGCFFLSTQARQKVLSEQQCDLKGTPPPFDDTSTSSLNTQSWDDMNPENKNKYWQQAPWFRSSQD